MKKQYLTASLLLIVVGTATAQSDLFNGNCGTWEKSSDSVYNWYTVDTINHKKVTTSKREWVTGEWRFEQSNTVNAVYCPCGCPSPLVYIQKRVCKLTGIRQERLHVEDFTYIRPPVKPYDKTVDSLTQSNP